MTIHLWQADTSTDSRFQRDVVIEEGASRSHLYFKVTNATPSSSMNSAVIATIFRAMTTKKDIVAHGAVSRTLLENIEDFQDAWSAWMPQYTKVGVSADEEVADSSTGMRRSIVAFSGGVDATFSLWRHARSRTPHMTDVKTALLVHGFDIPLHRSAEFRVAAESARRMANAAGAELVTLETNIRSTGLADRWPYTYVPALASCLHLFDDRHDVGIIGSDEPYVALIIPWGSNPITNPLLSSGRFQIKYDSGGFTRTQKVKALATWPPALENLRVCWQGPKTGRNCGRCEKCIRTILNFKAVGAAKPACFEADVTPEMVRTVNLANKIQRSFMQDILEVARANGVTDAWVEALEVLLRKNPSKAPTST